MAVLSQENVRLIVGLTSCFILLGLIVMSELGHVPLEDRTIYILAGLILSTVGFDIWRGQRSAKRWTDRNQSTDTDTETGTQAETDDTDTDGE